MKKSKEYVGIVLTFIVTLMLVGMISGTVKAENIRSGEYEYSLSSGDATIEKYLGSATDVIIPSTLDGYEVKGIDYDAFLNSKISKVTIPEGITRISFEAFKNCESLSTVNFNAVNCEGTVSPGSPISTGLFLVFRERIRTTLRISLSRPMTGSSF